MKFIIDANLPKRLSRWLIEKGYDSIHTLDLVERNLTEDEFILQLSMNDKRVVVTKDKDFFNSYIIKKEPYKLILVIAGNLSNDKLIKLFEENLDKLIVNLESDSLIELDNDKFIIFP